MTANNFFNLSDDEVCDLFEARDLDPLSVEMLERFRALIDKFRYPQLLADDDDLPAFLRRQAD